MQVSVARRVGVVRAEKKTGTSPDVEELVKDLTEKVKVNESTDKPCGGWEGVRRVKGQH